MSTSTRDVSRMLQSYSRQAIETWARSRGLDLKRTASSRLAGELSTILLKPAALKETLAQITPDEQIALARLKGLGGLLPVQELKAQIQVDGVENPDATIAKLMARGLLFYDRGYETYGYNRWELWSEEKSDAYTPSLWLPEDIAELVTIPDDLGYVLMDLAPELAPEIREPPFAALQRDIYLLLQALRENPVKLLKSGDVGKRDSERLLKILPRAGAENDPTSQARKEGTWFQFVWLLLQHAGLIRAEPDRLVPSDKGLAFLRISEAEQAARLLNGWRTFTEWSEMRRAPTLAFEVGAGYGDVPSPPRVLAARASLMELIRHQRPYPGWYQVPSLIESMRRMHVAMLIPRCNGGLYSPWGSRSKKEDRSYRGIYAKGSSPKRYFDKDRDWAQVEGAFFRAVLEESLFWLGIVRLGYRDGQLVSFALTERAARALGFIQPSAVSRQPSAEGARALVVQPNFEIVIYPEVGGVALLVELDRFAERVRFDQAALYRLTRPAFCRGLQEGLGLAEAIHFLETHNGGPLPQNVAYTLHEWGQLYERIHVRRVACLIEASDDAELQALRALSELEGAREVAPRVLLVSAGTTLPRLRQKTETIDYTAPIVNALEFETATRFRVLPEAAGPKLVHRVLQIADPVGKESHHGDTEDTEKKEREDSYSSPSAACLRGEITHFELSREKVARVARWWKWEEINAFLAGTAKKKPSPELAIILKGWAGELASPSLAPITVLTAPSASWLDQVLLVPEVKPLILQRLTPSVALIRQEDRSKLEAALASIGVTLAEGARVGDLLAAAGKADAEEGEYFLVSPPRKRRTLIDQAIAQKRAIEIATVEYNSTRLHRQILEPLRVEGAGGGTQLVARVQGHRYEYQFSLNRIQGVRMLDTTFK